MHKADAEPATICLKALYGMLQQRTTFYCISECKEAHVMPAVNRDYWVRL